VAAGRAFDLNTDDRLRLVNAFLDSVGPYAPFLVFLLAAGKSAAFLGLFIPGEAAVVFGGVLS